MPQSQFYKFNSFVEAEAEKVHNLQSDTLKVMLSNVAPLATNSQKSHITEIAASNGYPAGGTQATQVSSQQTNGLYRLIINDVVFTPSGGNIPQFRYAILYNDTAVNDELIGYHDYGSGISPAVGEPFTVDYDGTTGVLDKQ